MIPSLVGFPTQQRYRGAPAIQKIHISGKDVARPAAIGFEASFNRKRLPPSLRFFTYKNNMVVPLTPRR